MATVTVTFPFAITSGDLVGTNNFTSAAGSNNTLSYNSTASAGYASSTGCLQSLRAIKSATSSSNTWIWNTSPGALTYVALGVPSGSTVTGISNASIWWKCTSVTSPASSTAGAVTLNDTVNTTFNLASVWGTAANTSTGETFALVSGTTCTASLASTGVLTLGANMTTNNGLFAGMSIGTSGGGTNTCNITSQISGTNGASGATYQTDLTGVTVASTTWTVNNNAYAKMPGTGTTFTAVPASSVVRITINNTLASTSVTSSGETLLQDQLTFTITYTPPATKIGGHGGRSWENSLLGRWALNEGAGTVAWDSAGTQNHGTLATAASILPTYVRSEKFNTRVLAFEDTNSYVDLGAMNYADMTAADSFSVACWIKYQEAYFTASQSTTTLTVTAVSDGIIAAGMSIQTTAGASAATISAFGTNGTTGVGGAGTYALSTSATVASITWVGTRYVRFNPIVGKYGTTTFSSVIPGWELYMDRGAIPSATTGFGGFQTSDNLGNQFTVASSKAAPANKWHFVVGVYDANASLLKVSIDGQAFGTTSTTGAGSFTSTRHVLIGFDNTTSQPGLKFHDLRIWKRALTAGEVSQLYQITERPKLWPPSKLSQVLGAGGLNTVLAFSNKSWVWLGQGAKFNTAETPPEKSWVWNKQAFTQDFKPAIPQKFWVWSPAGAILPKTTVLTEKSWVWSKSFKFDFEPQTNQKLWVWAKQAITVATTPTFATKNWVWNKAGPVQAFTFATLPEKNWVWTKQAATDALTITPPEKSWVWSKSFTYTFAPALPKVNWVWKPTTAGFSSYQKDFFVWNPQAPVLKFTYPMPLQAWAWAANGPHIGSPIFLANEINWVWNPQAPTLQYATHLVEKNWVYQGESFPANTTNVETVKPEPWTKHAPLFGFANVETEKNYVWTKNVITLARNAAMIRKNWNFATNPASLSGGNITTKALHYAGGFPTRRRRSHPPE